MAWLLAGTRLEAGNRGASNASVQQLHGFAFPPRAFG
jgi:hypothetical protein